MKSILLILAITGFMIVPGSFAADPPQHVYRGEIPGVVCSACASHVKAALLKLEGVSSVTITLPKGGGVSRLEVVSSSEKLTREMAVKALGDNARTYDIRSLRMEK